MAKNSKKEQQDKDEAKKILAEVNFSDDEMAIAQKLAEEFMRHENPEEYGPGWIKVMWSDTGKVGRASFVMVEIIN